MRRLLSVIAALVLVLTVSGCRGEAGEPSGAESRSSGCRLETALEELDRRKLPVIVAYSRDGEEPAVQEFGLLRVDGLAPEETLVDIGSITKTVTAVAISKLVDQGKIRLDETLGDVLSDVPTDKSAITAKQLLTHSGGLAEAVGDDSEQLDRDDFLARAFASELVQAPGAGYAYSNVGYSILAAVIEIRSGRSYEEYLHEEVLSPAGLGDIGYLSSYDDARSLRSSSGSIYDASWGGHDASWHLIGNGGLVTTAETFVAFLQALTDGTILSSSSLEQLTKPHIAEDDGGSSFYGFGLVVQDVPDVGRFLWHDGGNDVFSAEWSMLVDSQDVFFVAGLDETPGAGTASEAMSIVRECLDTDP